MRQTTVAGGTPVVRGSGAALESAAPPVPVRAPGVRAGRSSDTPIIACASIASAARRYSPASQSSPRWR